jgi:hypothetical protein
MSAPSDQVEASSAAATPQQQQSAKSFNFGALPPELRDKVLAENLIVDDGEAGLVVRSGTILSFPELTESLFDASNQQLRAEALDVLLLQNRIVLDGDFDKSLDWLREQGDAVLKIRILDLQLDTRQVHEFAQPGSLWPAQWDALIEFIGENLDVENLVLSLDHGPCYEYYQGMHLEEKDLPEVRSAYEKIMRSEPLLALGKKGLKAFYVFWAAFHNMEEEAERLVMGDGYTPPGKVAHTVRDPVYPHRVNTEDWKLRFPSGMDLSVYLAD